MPDTASAFHAELHSNNMDICFAFETWLNNRIPSHLVCPSGYILLRKDRAGTCNRAGGTDSPKIISCRSKSTNSFALNKSVSLMREEAVIKPVRRSGGILSIWLLVDRLAIHPSALLLTRKQLTHISCLSTLNRSTWIVLARIPFHFGWHSYSYNWCAYFMEVSKNIAHLRVRVNLRSGSGLCLPTCANNHQSI